MGLGLVPIHAGDFDAIRRNFARINSILLGPTASPTWAGLTLTGLTANSLIYTPAGGALTSLGAATNGQLPIGSTGADPVLATITGTANQVVSTPGAGAITLSLPQDIHTAATPTFAGGTFTGVVTGISPTLAAHLATKEYVDLAIGSEIDFFFSNTASGVGSNYLMYPLETGEAQSTLNSSALAQGNNQLCFSFLTEAGQPGITHLREGVYSIHAHLNNGTGHKPTTIYATISYVDADGSSNETLVATSEVTGELTDSVTAYDFHAAISTEVDIDTTKRVLVKFYANVGASGTNSTVTITMEGTSDSHVALSTSSEIYQRQGAVLDDLNTVGIVTGDDYMLVGTAAGVFAWETGATLRTSIGVDAAGVAAGLVSGHESTYNHTNYNTAYSHSQLTSGNPHSVTPTELGLVIGTNVQAYDAGLTSLAGLTFASASFLKCTAENTYAVRTIAETKQDLSLNVVENTALSTWVGTTNITTLGTIATGVWNGTDIAIADGGTGQGTAQLAINALSAVAAATNEHVLTKDTATGNAIFKAAAGGSDVKVAVDAAATAGYIGAASNDGVLRTGAGLSYTDGGDFVTLAVSGTFVHRGDPAGKDKTDFIADDTWRDWDLSAIVPAGAKAVLMHIAILDDVAGNAFEFRRNGNTDIYAKSRTNTQVANIPMNQTLIVACDENRVVEYTATNTTWTALEATITGWWI